MKNSIISIELRKIATGTSVYGITKSNLSKVKLLVPSITEQKKIADILSSVDEKMESLKQKSEEFSNLKKGLMEQLLTGRIRVKV